MVATIVTRESSYNFCIFVDSDSAFKDPPKKALFCSMMALTRGNCNQEETAVNFLAGRVGKP